MTEIPTYIIVGATGGIGSVLCQQLASHGACNIMLAARDKSKLEELENTLEQADLKKHSSRVAIQVMDARDSAQVTTVFAAAIEKFGNINGVVNLCGSIILKPAHLTSDEEFRDTISVNLVTAFNVLRAAARSMTTGGSVVLMSTVATRIGLANHEAIAAAKAGVNGLVISAAATYATRNLRINAVAPGLVRTPLASKITGNELALKASTSMHPLGRIGEPNDVAAAIMWLLDPSTTWVTGQVISVDGGLSTVRAK